MLIIACYISLLVFTALSFSGAWFWRGQKRGKGCFWLGYSVAIAILFEGALLLMFAARERTILFLRPPNPNRQIFESHPHLVVHGIANATATIQGTTISHNSQGFRGPEISEKKGDKRRIMAIGGSTTYGVSVSDKYTWTAFLQRELGEKVEVINAGIPAASTVEHIHLMATIVPEIKPDIILLHIGLNDMRNMHARGLKPDYSNFHPPSMIGNVGLCPEELLPRVATIRALVMFLQRCGLYPTCSFNQRAKGHADNATIDQYAVNLFERNVKTLILLAKAQGIQVVLIPQILIDEMVSDGSYRWWTPYIAPRFLVTANAYYNRILAEQATAAGQLYASSVLEVDWRKIHFADPSHLNKQGNEYFAVRLAKQLKQELQL